ncbi:MAG: AAA family ATPase, partial [Pseudonocardia sp.]|nr:AAA family ATPase [Pseudonocardia sp.]
MAARGFGRVVVVEGEAGIGKTRLLQEAVAAAHGFEVRAGAADELERRRPFGVIADALGVDRAHAGSSPDEIVDEARVEVATLLHGTGGTSGPGSTPPAMGLEFRVGEALLGLVERLCARGPVLVVLEDLHWGDPATLSWLARFGRGCAQLPLLVLVSTRPLPPGSDVGRVLDGLAERGAVRLGLGPLGGADIPALAAAVVGSPPGPNLRLQLSRAGGNPLLVIELLAVLAQNGAIDRAGGLAEVGEVAASAAPSITILHRLSFLSSDALDVLSMASVVGSTFSVGDLCLLSARPAARLAAPLREALRAGALAERGGRLGFRHELIRDALYTDLPVALRETLHLDLARALAAAGAPPRRVAEHLLRGPQAGDPEAVDWLRRAAEEALSHSPAMAVELLDHAMELADPISPASGLVAADRAVALMLAGRGEEGEAACREVLAHHRDPDREGALRWLLLRTTLIRGQAGKALEQIDQALALSTASEPERAHYRASASFARLLLGQLDSALDLAEQAIALAEPTNDSLAISESLHAKAQVLSFQGRLAESADLAVRAHRCLGPGYLPRGPQTVTTTAGLMLIATDRVADGTAMLLRGREVNEALGAASGLALHHVVLADGLFLTGAWDDAVSEIEAGVGLDGEGPAWPVMSLGVLAMIAVHRDEIASARSHLAAAGAALAAGAGPMRPHRMVLAGALLAEVSGRDDEALATLDAGWGRFAAAGMGAVFPELGPELVRRLMPAGERARAAEVAAAVQECAGQNPGVANIEGAALLCRGLTEAAPELMVAAVEAYRRGAQPLAHALACEDAASALARIGRRPEARTLLGEAREQFEGLGAVRGEARTDAALRRLGLRRGSRAPRTRATTGWDAITATEHKVIALVAQRLSNSEIAVRMYLSRRTVETHVSHALAKLGVGSRLELAAEVIRHRPGKDLTEDRQQL